MEIDLTQRISELFCSSGFFLCSVGGTALRANLTHREREGLRFVVSVHRRDLNAALSLKAERIRLGAVGADPRPKTLVELRVRPWEARQCDIETRIPRL